MAEVHVELIRRTLSTEEPTRTAALPSDSNRLSARRVPKRRSESTTERALSKSCSALATSNSSMPLHTQQPVWRLILSLLLAEAMRPELRAQARLPRDPLLTNLSLLLERATNYQMSRMQELLKAALNRPIASRDCRPLLVLVVSSKRRRMGRRMSHRSSRRRAKCQGRSRRRGRGWRPHTLALHQQPQL